MGQYSGFVARYTEANTKQILLNLRNKGIDQFTLYENLHLIIGLIKSDINRGAFIDLIECGLEDFRILGQLGHEKDDYPINADICKD